MWSTHASNFVSGTKDSALVEVRTRVQKADSNSGLLAFLGRKSRVPKKTETGSGARRCDISENWESFQPHTTFPLSSLSSNIKIDGVIPP